MIIVLINWRIKPDKVEDFMLWWTSKEADIKQRGCVVGEFLSKPLALEELKKRTPGQEYPFRVCDLTPGSCDEPYIPFVNVGLWESWEAFYSEVGKNFNDTGEKRPFEQYRRTRTILEPQNWRIGDYDLPGDDKLDGV